MLDNKNPKISVLMPVYNMEKYVSEAIESILDQTYTEFEFIIIDDCSTDKTWEIIKEYAGKDKRIIIEKNERNLGISGTRNKLISLAKGIYVVWQDADDISSPYRIDHQYKFMEEHPEIGISGGFINYFSEEGDHGIRKYPADDQALRKMIFKYSPIAQPAAIIRKECFDVTGLFPMASPVAEDLAMSFQIGTKYKFGNLQEVLIKYRENRNGATFRKLKKMELYSIFLRYVYSRSAAYSPTWIDKAFNFIHLYLVFIIPSQVIIWVATLIRNDRN
jgi:glycosyltransferase involved in cell wall biosynthesis